MAADGNTTVRVKWSTKRNFRKAAIERGFPASISDGDAINLLVEWVDEYVPRNPVRKTPTPTEV